MNNNSNYIPSSRDDNLMPLGLPDCIHLTERCKCIVLRVNKCLGEGCSFRQTADDSRNSQEKWHEEMNSISDEAQKRIARAYYGGKMPWKDK